MYYYYNTNDKRTFDVVPFGGFLAEELRTDTSWPFVELVASDKGNFFVEKAWYIEPVEGSKVEYIQRVSERFNSGNRTIEILKYNIKE